MQAQMNIQLTVNLEDRCTLLSSLRRSFLYLQERILRAAGDDRTYWLTQARLAYSLYRRASFGETSPVDRYSAIVQSVTWKETH